MQNLKAFAVAGAVLMAPAAAFASTVSVNFVDTGVTVGSSAIFSADLSGTGLAQVGSVKITDQSGGTGGASGIFSGFDIDAIFLDVDGSLATTGDQFFASSYQFQAGTTRPTADPALLPNASHPGPTFGSLNATTIDFATATLETLDGISVADVDIADGFLSLGDGGTLTANFLPTVPLGSTLFLITGEVGGNGESLLASVEVSENPQVVPLPAAGWMLLAGLGGLAVMKRRKHAVA